MAEEIRGLTVKFDSDFTEFKKNIKLANKDISSTEKQLKTLQESLKLKWDPKKFKQAQSQAQDAIVATEKKVELLRHRLQEMEKAGVTDKTRDEYNWLTEEISKTELSAQRLEDQLENLNKMKLTGLTSGIDKFSNSMDTAANKTKGLSLAAGATVTGLVASGLKAVEQADEIATLATTYSMSTDAIQRFNYVALQTDTAAESLYKGFVKVQAGVSDLSSGVSSVATKALNELGLSFDQFSGAEEQFYAIIDALSDMENQAKMVSLANDIFGERMATGLFPLIYAGTEAVNGYREEFEQMGSLTEDQIEKLAQFDNVLNSLKTQYTNVALSLGESFLPVLETFSEVLSEDVLPILRDIVEWFDGLSEGEQKALISLLLFTAALSPTLKLLANMSGSVSSLVKWLGKLEASTLKTCGKWALLAASVGSLLSVLANWGNMNTTQKVIGLLGSLAAAALAAAVAFGVFHSAWSLGLAVAGIVAGIAAATAAINAAGKDIGAEVSLPDSSGGSYTLPDYDVPEYPTSPQGNTEYVDNSVIDNSIININIEKNEYMTEEDIIQAVNKGLKQIRQARK